MGVREAKGPRTCLNNVLAGLLHAGPESVVPFDDENQLVQRFLNRLGLQTLVLILPEQNKELFSISPGNIVYCYGNKTIISTAFDKNN